MKEEPVVLQQQKEIGTMRDPNLVLAEAKKAAEALMKIVSQKKKPVIMNGETYLEFEDWQVLGKFYGLSARVTRTAYLDIGGVKGYEASADVIRMSDGVVISSADAMCLNDEDKWSSRTKYEYRDILDEKGKTIWVKGKDGKNHPKTERVRIGDVPVPIFQLRSMAQTRACAKGLRNVLAWVVVLAGYKPTVAEEMIGDEIIEDTPAENGKPTVQMPQEKKKEETEPITCKGCAQIITEAEREFSERKYKKALCRDCQKKEDRK